VACDTLKWLVKRIMLIWYLSMIWMIILVYLSMYYSYEMECVVLPLYPCCINVILCIFTIYHTILSHDYTHSFRHPTFCKIVQLSSHMLLSVIFAIINSCTYSRGSSLYKFGKQNSIMLNYWKTLSVCHQSTKKERLKVHLDTRVDFGGLMTNN
jgi:hypothetical protein